jgi:hypothetical protein
MDWTGTAVPSSFYVYFLLAGMVSGAIFAPPFLLLVSLAMLLAARWLHRPHQSVMNQANQFKQFKVPGT